MKLLVVFLVLWRLSVADEMSEMWIQPEKSGAVTAGIDYMLTCHFVPDIITEVKWLSPLGVEITESAERTFESESDRLFMTLVGISSQDEGRYTCEGLSSLSNATVSMTTEVTVFDPVEIINTPAVQEFRIGDTVQVICEVKGQPKPEVYWSKDLARIDTEADEKYSSYPGTSYLVINAISKKDEGAYECKARESIRGQKKRKVVQVNVLIPPEIVDFKPDIVVVEGDDASLQCNATGDPEPSYSWYGGDGTILDETTFVQNGSNLQLRNTSRTQSRSSYTCVARNKIASNVATATVTVNVKPFFTLTEGDSTQEKEGAVLRCTAMGDPTPVVTFSRNGIQIEATEDAIPEDDDTFDGNYTGNMTGMWSSNRQVVYNGNVAIINFTYTTDADVGYYDCAADSEAGSSSASVYLDVKYAPREVLLENKWACKKTRPVLECSFDANPPAALEWGRFEPQEGGEDSNSTFVAFNVTDPPEGYVLETVHDVLTLTVDLSVASDGYGEYSCRGVNVIGESLSNAGVYRAQAPDPPMDVDVGNITTRTATVMFYPPMIHQVAISYYIITLTPASSDAQQVTRNIHGSSDTSLQEYTFTELEHDMEYAVVVEAENCADTSRSSEVVTFRTEAIVQPEPVDIISGKVSDDHDKYTVAWSVNDLGGGEIAKIAIVLNKVIPGIDGNNVTRVEEASFEIKPADDGFDEGEYTINDLDPASQYEVSVNVYNEVGAAESTKLFITATKPEVTTAAGPTDVDQLARGSIDVILIIIIVAVLLLLIIIIDVTCFFTRSWGCTMWIYLHTCGKSKKQKVDDAEEGSAEYRAKLTPINEQTPLQTEGDEAHAKEGNGNTSGAKESETKEPNDSENVTEQS